MSFRSKVRVKGKKLKLKLAQTYIVSGLFGLEFVDHIPSNKFDRFKYYLSTFFGIKYRHFENYARNVPWLDLNSVLNIAQNRRKQLPSPLRDSILQNSL